MSAKTFACNVNTGAAELMVASYVAPAGTSGITGMEAVIDIQSSTPTMPDWWLFKNAGSCRQTALAVAPNGAACDGDYWAGQASGGVTAYITPYRYSDLTAPHVRFFTGTVRQFAADSPCHVRILLAAASEMQ